MRIDHLHVRSFRNFADQIFAFGPSCNILIGDNAQGKTNVLEAIAFLAHGRSFRTGSWRDLIRHGDAAGCIDARVGSACGEDALRVELKEPRKRFERNGKSTAPGGFKGVGAVVFAPEEILLLRTQPGARRRFIDTFISQFQPTHRKDVRNYESVVAQRNRILSDDELERHERRARLAPWDDQLIALGTRIMLTRRAWIDKINEYLPRHYRSIAAGDRDACFAYEPHAVPEPSWEEAGGVMDAFRAELERRSSDEEVRRTTVVGPHRDDLVAYIGDGAVKRFASQGQHRSFVLALKIAEMDVHRDETGEQPPLLLDDVASELDPGRNRRFFEYVQGAEGQVFITATSREDVRFMPHPEAVQITIEQGSARRS